MASVENAATLYTTQRRSVFRAAVVDNRSAIDREGVTIDRDALRARREPVVFVRSARGQLLTTLAAIMSRPSPVAMPWLHIGSPRHPDVMRRQHVASTPQPIAMRYGSSDSS